jgi:hypothetical protein
MAPFEFEATSVAVEHPDGECHLVGFADHAFDPTTYLLLQRALAFDAQDVALGMDTYHVEWCGQATSGYGGISQCLLRPGHAQIAFAPNALAALAGMELLTISFRLTPSEHLALREALGHIFEGSGGLLVADS